ncbi:Heavy metal transport/detoxification protein [Parvibaculum lavamentivorans DS-1]|uniref:Heavy metal transport/detoxification protein n=1 Tax=Parvibaculum lavamentivorans (strain DS-1 / DSM 13023 / NCIMB 13966) TaxID=402881 RepID=A7HYJ5_PARL1|nr:heavy metal-associated domain-containing protein [Parvibaculum lavamentivorans]ABS64978.1 Heavy metal transport/detoxification protein [Parvibaculum lavamentivorans DS-1]
MAATRPYKLYIDGMDCAACALKIEKAMYHLPGVSDVDVSHANGTLALQLDEDRTASFLIEERVRSLGYIPLAGHVEPETRQALGR